MAYGNTNPIASVAGGVSGDLGLSSTAQTEAKAIAEKLKKKKQQQDADAASAGGQMGGTAMSDIMKGMF